VRTAPRRGDGEQPPQLLRSVYRLSWTDARNRHRAERGVPGWRGEAGIARHEGRIGVVATIAVGWGGDGHRLVGGSELAVLANGRTSEDHEHTRGWKGALTCGNAGRSVRGRVTTASVRADVPGQWLGTLKSKKRGGSGSLSAARMDFCPAVVAER